MPVFLDQRTLLPGFARPLLAPVAARLGLETPSNPEPADIHMELSWPDSAASIWEAMPAPASAAFLAPGARVSVALQSALRAWLPYVWLSQPEHFEDFDHAAVLLMYSACRPYTPRNKDAFVFDILHHDTPRAMHYSISRSLRFRLEGFEEALNAAGVSNARRYAVRRWDRMLELLPKRSHEMNSILVAERELVEGYLEQANPAKRERGRIRIERVLRKLFLKRDFSYLAGMFEWEALRAAHHALGRASQFEGKIFANSQLLAPLARHEDHSFCNPVDLGAVA